MASQPLGTPCLWQRLADSCDHSSESLGVRKGERTFSCGAPAGAGQGRREARSRIRSVIRPLVQQVSYQTDPWHSKALPQAPVCLGNSGLPRGQTPPAQVGKAGPDAQATALLLPQSVAKGKSPCPPHSHGLNNTYLSRCCLEPLCQPWRTGEAYSSWPGRSQGRCRTLARGPSQGNCNPKTPHSGPGFPCHRKWWRF